MKPRSEWQPGETINIEEGDMPIVFAFRPNSMQIVPPEGVAEWEQLMTEKVGIKPGWDDTAIVPLSRTVCSCGSGLSGWDDCDQLK